MAKKNQINPMKWGKHSFVKHHSGTEKVEFTITHGAFTWRMTRAWLGRKPDTILAHYQRIY